MATVEPLTGATLPEETDAPQGGLQIARAANGIVPMTVPRYPSTGARDQAFAAWVQQGNQMTDWLLCTVTGVGLQAFLSGKWQTVLDGSPLSRPFGVVYGSGTQNVGNGVPTPLSLTSVQTAQGMTATGGGLRANIPGWYMVSGMVSWPAASPYSGRRIAGIALNGSVVTQSNSSVAVTAIVNMWVPTASLAVALNVNDLVQVLANQDTGATLSVDRGSRSLTAHWIGGL